MAITDLSGLTAGYTSGGYKVAFNKANIANQILGSEASLWRATGFPAQGAIPTTAAVCNDALTGAFPLAARSGSQDRCLAKLDVNMALAGHGLIIEDRLMHLGGLVGNLATSQAAVVDLNANLATSNLAARIGNADYSEVEWYLEWYADTGSSASTPTVSVTLNDGTSTTTGVWVAGGTALPVTVRASRRYRIVQPTAGKYIRAVTAVQLSVTTGTAGNFGVTAVKRLSTHQQDIASITQVRDWTYLGLPKIQDNACVTFSQLCNTTSTGATQGLLLQAVN